MFVDENTIKKQVGIKIKKYRQNMKLTQFKLGELIDINQRQVALLEAGKSFPSLITLSKMANIFDCKVADLFESDDDLSEDELKNRLIQIISSSSPEDCRRLYSIAKSFLLV